MNATTRLWIRIGAWAMLLALPLSATARPQGDSRHPDPRGSAVHSRCAQTPQRHHRRGPPPRPYVFPHQPTVYYGAPASYYVPPPVHLVPSPQVVFYAPPPPPVVVYAPPPPPVVAYPVRPGIQLVFSF